MKNFKHKREGNWNFYLLKNGRDILHSWLSRINTKRRAILPKAKYRANVILIKIPVLFCTEIEKKPFPKIHMIHMEAQKIPIGKQSWAKTILLDCTEVILQSHRKKTVWHWHKTHTHTVHRIDYCLKHTDTVHRIEYCQKHTDTHSTSDRPLSNTPHIHTVHRIDYYLTHTQCIR